MKTSQQASNEIMMMVIITPRGPTHTIASYPGQATHSHSILHAEKQRKSEIDVLSHM